MYKYCMYHNKIPGDIILFSLDNVKRVVFHL